MQLISVKLHCALISRAIRTVDLAASSVCSLKSVTECRDSRNTLMFSWLDHNPISFIASNAFPSSVGLRLLFVDSPFCTLSTISHLQSSCGNTVPCSGLGLLIFIMDLFSFPVLMHFQHSSAVINVVQTRYVTPRPPRVHGRATAQF